MSIANVIGALRCPVCHAGLAEKGESVRCAAGHTFDIARSGYLNLASGGPQPSTADTKEMVSARLEAMGAGLYDPLIDAVARVSTEAAPPDVLGIVVDSGGGTGEYLAAVLGAAPERHGIVLDASKHAVAIAARRLPEAGVVVCDIWKQLPLQDGAAAIVLDVFAPRNPAEFHRVLAPGGALVVVTPAPEHLGELVEVMGLITVDADKRNRLTSALEGHFTLESNTAVTGHLNLTRGQALAVALMGPSGAREGLEELAMRAKRLPEPFTTGFSARIGVYRPR